MAAEPPGGWGPRSLKSTSCLASPQQTTGHPSALFIVYSFVVFLPMAPNIVMSVYFVAKRVLTVFFKVVSHCDSVSSCKQDFD